MGGWAMGRSRLGEEVLPAVVVYGVDPGYEGAVVRWARDRDGQWQVVIWQMDRAQGLLVSAEARESLVSMIALDKGRAGVVRAVVEWPTVVAGRSFRASMLTQGCNVGRVAGWFELLGVEVWFVDPTAWRAAVGVQTPEREPPKALKKADKEAIGDAAAVAEFRKRRRAQRADEAKVLLLEAGVLWLKQICPWWTVKHPGVIDAALIGMAEIQTTSRVGWRRL